MAGQGHSHITLNRDSATQHGCMCVMCRFGDMAEGPNKMFPEHTPITLPPNIPAPTHPFGNDPLWGELDLWAGGGAWQRGSGQAGLLWMFVVMCAATYWEDTNKEAGLVIVQHNIT